MGNSYYPEEYLTAAYDSGYAAFFNGYDISECPTTYPWQERNQWIRGWKDAYWEYHE